MHRARPRLTYANVMSTIALFVALGGGAYAAVSATPGPDGVIHGCYQKKKGTLRIVSTGKRCSKSEKAIAFNQRGPTGATGSTGSPGARGEQGPRGPTATVDTSQFFTKEQSDTRYPSASLFGNPVSVTNGVVGDSSCFVGEIRLIAGDTAPANWSLAHGQLLEIVGDEILFNLIGTDYGGDGISNFRLPDLRGAEPRGAGPAGVNYFICRAGIFP